MRLAQIARDYLAAGRKVIDLAEGEPDFDTPESVVERAFQAAKSGATRYTSVGGTKQLLAAIADKFSRENNLEYDHDQIMASSGAKQLIFNAMFCTLNANDEVIIPSPYWVSYPDIVQLCGGRTVIVPCMANHCTAVRSLPVMVYRPLPRVCENGATVRIFGVSHSSSNADKH